jgi:hypothetical protein
MNKIKFLLEASIEFYTRYIQRTQTKEGKAFLLSGLAVPLRCQLPCRPPCPTTIFFLNVRRSQTYLSKRVTEPPSKVFRNAFN